MAKRPLKIFLTRMVWYGSRYFAKQLRVAMRSNFAEGYCLTWSVTGRSASPFRQIHQLRWRATSSPAAEALKVRNYFSYLDRDLIDDHAPLNAIGVATIDVIDFDYPSWHTAGDTMDKISAQSLQIVGSVALYYLSEFALK